MSTEANIRRVEVEIANDYNALVNKITGGPVYLPRGRDIILQVGYRASGIWINNPPLASVTAEVRPFTNRAGTALVTATSSTFANCPEADWESGTSQHFSLLLDAAQTASLATANETDYWLVLTAVTTGGKAITLASGRAIGVNDAGNYSAVQPTPGDPTYVTASQFFAALASLQNNVITGNGYTGRLGIDANGRLVLHLQQ